MSFSEFLKRFAVVAVVVLLWTGVWAARSTLLMGFAAALVAVGLSIPTRWLQRHGIRRGWALAVTILGFIMLLLILLLWLVPRLFSEFVTLLETIPAALRALADVYAALRARSPFLEAALPAPPAVRETTIDPVAARALLNQFLNAGLAIAPTLWGGLNNVLTVLLNFGFVLFIAIFFVIDPQAYVKASLYLLPQHQHVRVIDIWNRLYDTVRTWITTLMLSISITMTLVWIVLGLLLGMPNAVIVAVFAGLATFVPNIGAFLPLIPIAVFSLASDPGQFFILAPAYLLIQLLESNVITPSLINAELDIPPGGLLIFQLLMTIAFGALGLILAVPMLAVLIVVVREIYSYGLLGLHLVKVELESDTHGNLVIDQEPRAPEVAEGKPGHGGP